MDSYWWVSILVICGLFGIWMMRKFGERRITFLKFLVAGRSVDLLLGIVTVTFSYANSPSFFVSSQKAYEQGLAGSFWFSVPNATALGVVQTILAVRMLSVFGQGFTLAQFMGFRMGRGMEVLYVVSVLFLQGYYVVLALTAALLLLTSVTGLPREVLILLLSTWMIIWSLSKGMEASLWADRFKAAWVVLGICMVWWITGTHGGLSSISGGFGGVSGNFANMFDLNVAWIYGVPFTLSLLSSPPADEQQWQRVFSLKKEHVKSVYIWGGICFFLFVILFGVPLGFLAANPVFGITVGNTQLAGVAAIQSLFPQGMLVFTLMIIFALMASGTSALNAASSVGSVNVLTMIQPHASDKTRLFVSRITMAIVILVGGVYALTNPDLVWLILAVGVLRSALLVATIGALYWARMNALATLIGCLVAMGIGIVVYLYGTQLGDPNLKTIASLLPIPITLAFVLVGTWLAPSTFRFEQLKVQRERIENLT